MLVELVVVFFALVLDLTFGDPRNRFHPTVWIGTFIAKLVSTARCNSRMCEKFVGIYVVIIPISVTVFLLALLDVWLDMLTGLVFTITTIVVIGVLLKTTIAIRGMESHAMIIVDALEADDLLSARQRLAMIVKRDTTTLDRNHVYSAIIESVSENTVDGITGPLFYFGFFGIFGSFVYRIVNTADSMVGYKTRMFKDMGWFAATSDKVLNYIPSRLTGLVMVISSIPLHINWRESFRIMIRDGAKTESPNAGYPMAAIAGALETKLEKINHYSIGDGVKQFSREHVIKAITLMKLTSILFGVIVVVPVIILMSYVGLWIHV